MPDLPTLILASHGTPGARRAQALAFSLAQPGVTRIHHLLVIPDLWAGMQGDDWLNNAATRDTFGRYLETLLDREAAQEVTTLRQHADARGVALTSRVEVGDPTERLLTVAHQLQAPVVIGPPRPRRWPGLRSGLDLNRLARELGAPLFVAAHARD